MYNVTLNHPQKTVEGDPYLIMKNLCTYYFFQCLPTVLFDNFGIVLKFVNYIISYFQSNLMS